MRQICTTLDISLSYFPDFFPEETPSLLQPVILLTYCHRMTHNLCFGKCHPFFWASVTISESGRSHNACVIRRFTRRPPSNGESDASIAFWLRKGHSASKPLPQLAIREDAKFSVQNCAKKSFFANKEPITNFDACMILQKPAFSLKGNDF